MASYLQTPRLLPRLYYYSAARQRLALTNETRHHPRNALAIESQINNKNRSLFTLAAQNYVRPTTHFSSASPRLGTPVFPSTQCCGSDNKLWPVSVFRAKVHGVNNFSSARGGVYNDSFKEKDRNRLGVEEVGGSRSLSSARLEPQRPGQDNQVYTEEAFDDHQVAYASKTTWELVRTSLFFFLFQYKFFTDQSERIMSLMRKALGKRLSEFILKKLIYNQFVAGETNEEIQGVVERLQKEGIGPLIAVPIEDDIGTSSRAAEDAWLDHNLDQILECIDLCVMVSGSNPMFQLKMTALMSPQLTKALSVVCSQHEDGDDNAISKVAVKTLVQGMRGQKMDIPKSECWETLFNTHHGELQRVLKRFQKINNRVLETNTVAMVDAEYTYLNPALRHMTFAMKEICNQHKPLVFYTYQAYLKSTHPYLKTDMALAKDKGHCFGAKLVRGAYIFKERHLAEVEGYPDPVNDDFEATADSYRRCLDLLLDQASRDEGSIRFIIATHNEDSIRYAFKRMNDLGVPIDSKSILFGQLYGMADHVSYTLGTKGCSVVKSLPYGTVEDTIPYLSRRAHENRSIFENVRKEKQLVKKALRERMLRRT